MAHNCTEKDVADQFEEAISTLKKLPPVKAQGYFICMAKDYTNKSRNQGW